MLTESASESLIEYASHSCGILNGDCHARTSRIFCKWMVIPSSSSLLSSMEHALPRSIIGALFICPQYYKGPFTRPTSPEALHSNFQLQTSLHHSTSPSSHQLVHHHAVHHTSQHRPPNGRSFGHRDPRRGRAP